MEKKRADSISAVRSPRLNKLLRFYFLRFFRRTKLHGWEYDEITAVLGGARRKTRGKKGAAASRRPSAAFIKMRKEWVFI